MGAKLTKPAKSRLELARHISVPILLLLLLTTPWFFGGREPFGHLLSAGLSLLLFLSWLVISRHRALRVDLRPYFVIIPLTVLVGWSISSLLWSVSQFQSLVLLTTITQAALAFVVARDVLHEKLAQHFFVRLWVGVATIVWVIGSVIFLRGDYDRMTSLFYWANPLATYFLVAILASLFIQRTSTKRAARLWFVITSLLMSGLILTYSRAAWLIGVGLAVVLIYVSEERQAEALRLARVFLIGCAIAAGIIGIRQTLYRQPTINVESRISESPTSTSVKDRFQYWQEASVLFAERPLNGWGIGSYAEVHPRAQVSPTTAGNNPHNSFLQSLVEIGMVGGIAYLALIGGWLWQGWQCLRAKRTDLALTAWLAVTVIGLHSWLDLVSNYPALIMAGAVWMAASLAAPRKEFRLKHWPVAVPIVTAGLMLILGLGVSWNVYASSVDVQLVDSYAGSDYDATADLYRRIADRPVSDPDLLSQAAVNSIDQYDALAKSAPANFLNPALNYAQQAAQREPQDAKHVFALANVLERQGKVTEALARYRLAITLDPHNNPQYQIGYARLLQREGFVAEAIVALKTVLAEYTPDVIANRSATPMGQRLAVGYAVLADLYREKDDLGHAQQAISEAESLSPGNPFVQQVKASLETP